MITCLFRGVLGRIIDKLSVAVKQSSRVKIAHLNNFEVVLDKHSKNLHFCLVKNLFDLENGKTSFASNGTSAWLKGKIIDFLEILLKSCQNNASNL